MGIFQKLLLLLYVLRPLTNGSVFHEKSVWESRLVLEDSIYSCLREKGATTSSLHLVITKKTLAYFHAFVLLCEKYQNVKRVLDGVAGLLTTSKTSVRASYVLRAVRRGNRSATWNHLS